MGIVDNIRKRMGGNVADDNYDDAYEDDGYYADNFGSYEGEVQHLQQALAWAQA